VAVEYGWGAQVNAKFSSEIRHRDAEEVAVMTIAIIGTGGSDRLSPASSPRVSVRTPHRNSSNQHASSRGKAGVDSDQRLAPASDERHLPGHSRTLLTDATGARGARG
jgi:hypothetical protein